MIARTPGQIRGLVIEAIAAEFGSDPTEYAIYSKPGKFVEVLTELCKFCYDYGFMDAIDKQEENGGVK